MATEFAGPHLQAFLQRMGGARAGWDELLDASGAPRPCAEDVLERMAAWPDGALDGAVRAAVDSLAKRDVTFGVYGDARGTDRVFPFCLIPRIVPADDWRRLERGLVQRIRALEAFLDDLYGPQRGLDAGVVPRALVLGSRHYLRALRGLRPPGGTRIHIAGIDVVRDAQGVYRVLEDNLRTPSGVSYVLENRIVSKRLIRDAVRHARVRSVDEYPQRLCANLLAVAPVAPSEPPRAVVLTPGPFNSAYFEHAFLARRMGVELVEAGDLFVDANDEVHLRAASGACRVHTIYRRIDEDYLDPDAFRPDSVLGVRGLMRAYAKGKVALANAPGNGAADDKAVYAFVPDMIRYYLGEQPALEQVPTYVCLRDEDRAYVLDHLDQLVVKAVDEAGGYGMLMGPQSTAAEREEFRRRIQAEPRKYVAQPRVEISTCPTFDAATGTFGLRRVDLRPYVLNGPDGPWVLPGGLTRVALRPGSYVVNSSQGGGSKDTWVLAEDG